MLKYNNIELKASHKLMKQQRKEPHSNQQGKCRPRKEKEENLWHESYFGYLIFPWNVGDKPR
jgi:hypothetical protein